MNSSCRRLFVPFYKVLLGLALLQGGPALAFTLIELPETGPAPVPGNSITDTETLDTQVLPVTSALGTHLQGVFRGFAAPRGDGAGAGDGGLQSLWVNTSYTDFENTFSRTAYDGATHLLLAGLDFTLSENVLLGLALSTENTDIDTLFNFGNQEVEGVTIAPYFGWLITDNLSLDISLGKTDTDTDQYRTVGTIEILPGPVLVNSITAVTSSPSGERKFTALNLNGFWSAGNWHYGARLGHLSASSDQDGYTESDGTAVEASSVDLKQTQLGGDVAYGSGSSQLFLGVTLLKDSSTEEIQFPGGEQPSDDDDSLLIGLGWRYYGGDGVSAILEWSTRDGKDDYSEDGVSASLRFDFD